MLTYPKIVMLPNLTFCLHLLNSISFFLFVGRFKMQTGTLSAGYVRRSSINYYEIKII